ncbi:hypothetical protein [Deinococcus humi]|uniref:Uncharacterized protein n=1 Tax=Deinococcus humi TaxID=662880 RepID=A0A7W8JVC5_9DEIO|nr:hypothetical protein [Deinococcus humi]MBB5362486.1 hypothetical protein [Deinococcus humi]GGO28560.1 hypothetical protein GCM10008949_21310 [Deinococcus humi]
MPLPRAAVLKGQPDALANSLGAKIPAELKYKSLDLVEVNNGIYDKFVLTSAKVWYAGVWIDGPEDVILA